MKILVVSTISYSRLEKLLDTLIHENPNGEFEFYIVLETYGSESQTSSKYTDIISVFDSTDETEMEKIIDCVRNWPSFEFSIQTDEYAITILATINDKLGLVGLNSLQEKKFRDKVYMKQLLSDDVKKPKLYTLEDAHNKIIEYPVIIKPRTFAASRGVDIIHNYKELLMKLKGKMVDYERVSVDTFDDYEIEEFIDNDVCHIDGLVYDGEIIFCVASKYIGNCFGYTNGEILGSISCPKYLQSKARDFAEKINRDLHILNGAFHLEAFIRDNEFVFLEIGMRPGGSEIVPTIFLATGVDLSIEHLRAQIGIKPVINNIDTKCFGWLNYPCEFDENYSAVKSISFSADGLESLVNYEIPQIGSKANAGFVNYSINLGTFIFVSSEEGKVHADMEKVIGRYHFSLE